MTPLLVTGGTGFLGRALVGRLQREGRPLRALVRDRSRVPAGVEPIEGDLERTTDWSSVVGGCDAVIHLAARVHVMDEQEADPLAAFRKVNRDATLSMAEAAAKAGVRRFIYISSIKVNGEATTTAPFRATDPAAPIDPYGISKWEAEQGLAAIGARTGLEIVVIRPPLIHGPGAGGNLRRLLRLVARGIPLPFGAIRNSRRMVGVANLSDLIATSLGHPAAPGEPLLAGDAESISTPEMVRMLASTLGRPARLVPVPVSLVRLAGRLTGLKPEIERLTGSLEVDISRTIGRLGWTPPQSLADGVSAMARAWQEGR
jgi:nucleoside-diphosphate-sugar epimerase